MIREEIMKEATKAKERMGYCPPGCYKKNAIFTNYKHKAQAHLTEGDAREVIKELQELFLG